MKILTSEQTTELYSKREQLVIEIVKCIKWMVELSLQPHHLKGLARMSQELIMHIDQEQRSRKFFSPYLIKGNLLHVDTQNHLSAHLTSNMTYDFLYERLRVVLDKFDIHHQLVNLNTPPVPITIEYIKIKVPTCELNSCLKRLRAHLKQHE